MNDTHPDMHRRQIELLREAGGARRLQMAGDLTRRTIASAGDGLCRARPELSQRERELLWVRINYGAELERRLRAFLAAREEGT